jgi:hypothetical protein
MTPTETTPDTTPQTPPTSEPEIASKSKPTKKKSPTKKKTSTKASPKSSPKAPKAKVAAREPATRWPATFEASIVSYVIAPLLEDILEKYEVTNMSLFRKYFCQHFNTIVSPATFKAWLNHAGFADLFRPQTSRVRVPASRLQEGGYFNPPPSQVRPAPQYQPPYQPSPYPPNYDPQQVMGQPFQQSPWTHPHSQPYPPHFQQTPQPQPQYIEGGAQRDQPYNIPRRAPGEGIPPHQQSFDINANPDPLIPHAPIPVDYQGSRPPPATFEYRGEDGKPRTHIRG